MINIFGIISVVLFYILILLVGIWAARKNVSDGDQEEEVMLAGRNIGMFVGIFTMTATWVGGGYINGTAEIIYREGLIWCQAPLGYALSLVLGGIFFAHRMRKEGYVTMLDPLQEAFGGRMGGLLFLPALCGEVFWSAGILAALGATLAIVIDMDLSVAVILSAFIAIFYTWFGGLYSVAYTDVVQLGCIAMGLVLCIPFAWNNEAVNPMTYESQDWIGSIPDGMEWYYADYMLLLTFGGIPWQVYFQRVLSSKSAGGAEILSYIAAVGCILMAIPPILIGAIAKNTNWNETTYGGVLPIPPEDHRMILPMVIQYLTPGFVSFFGLGAVSAAVMSSADSSVLSASSMFARNVYKLIFRQRASDSEIMWVMRVSIFVVGALATYMALRIPTIYGLWAMCSDLVYVILFPQLLIVVHFKPLCNTYGSLSAYIIGLFIRLSGGEPLIKLPALIEYPLFDKKTGTQYFPFRTMAMLISIMFLLGVSVLMRWLFEKGILSERWDIFHIMSQLPPEQGVALAPIAAEEKKYTEEGGGGSGGAGALAALENPLPTRKPDPPLREIRRQISFTGASGLGSIKRKLASQTSVDSAIKHHHNETPPLVKSGGSSSFEETSTSPTIRESDLEDKKFSKGERRESFKHLKKEIKEIKNNIKEEVKEVKAELKEKAKHLPDGHRGSIAAVVERPSYKPIEKQTEF